MSTMDTIAAAAARPTEVEDGIFSPVTGAQIVLCNVPEARMDKA